MTRELIVQRIPIITSSTVVFTVYEKADHPLEAGGTHSTIMTFDGRDGWYGRLGTRRLPNEINVIPVGKERFTSVDAFHRAQYEEAYRAILDSYPELEANPTASYHSGEVAIRADRRNGPGDSSEVRVRDEGLADPRQKIRHDGSCQDCEPSRDDAQGGS